MPEIEPKDDPFALRRFVDAQAPVIAAALSELRAGRKRSHWMWFVFPQLRGLGQSAMAQRYGIVSLDEARAYLAHGVLAARLVDCTGAVLGADGRSLNAIFGSPDDMKFGSSMTLFARAAGAGSVFHEALEHHCQGQEDPRSVALLGEQAASAR